MEDYYDGPVAGIADYHGRPHVYLRRFDEQTDEYGDVFELRPVDPETFRHALEAWEIWLRWDQAFHAGATTLETHPALPEDRPRFEAIDAVVPQRIAELPGPVVRARGEFVPWPGAQPNGRNDLGATWTTLP